jgi:hypothetical protein
VYKMGERLDFIRAHHKELSEGLQKEASFWDILKQYWKPLLIGGGALGLGGAAYNALRPKSTSEYGRTMLDKFLPTMQAAARSALAQGATPEEALAEAKRMALQNMNPWERLRGAGGNTWLFKGWLNSADPTVRAAILNDAQRNLERDFGTYRNIGSEADRWAEATQRARTDAFKAVQEARSQERFGQTAADRAVTDPMQMANLDIQRRETENNRYNAQAGWMAELMNALRPNMGAGLNDQEWDRFLTDWAMRMGGLSGGGGGGRQPRNNPSPTP